MSQRPEDTVFVQAQFLFCDGWSVVERVPIIFGSVPGEVTWFRDPAAGMLRMVLTHVDPPVYREQPD